MWSLLIWLRLSARVVNRDKDLIGTTDAHRRPVRVHAPRPGKGLQAKQSKSLRAQDSAIQKPDQNRNNMSHSLYNHPYVLNHIQSKRKRTGKKRLYGHGPEHVYSTLGYNTKSALLTCASIALP